MAQISNKPQFTCDRCHGTFDRDWTDEEALAEKDLDFPDVPLEECAVVCEDCYQVIMGKVPLQ